MPEYIDVVRRSWEFLATGKALLSNTGTPAEAREKLVAHGDHVDHIALRTPYLPPFTAEHAA